MNHGYYPFVCLFVSGTVSNNQMSKPISRHPIKLSKNEIINTRHYIRWANRGTVIRVQYLRVIWLAGSTAGSAGPQPQLDLLKHHPIFYYLPSNSRAKFARAAKPTNETCKYSRAEKMRFIRGRCCVSWVNIWWRNIRRPRWSHPSLVCSRRYQILAKVHIHKQWGLSTPEEQTF